MGKWYERDLRRILVDMHIPDWNERFFKNFDAEKYADMMAKAHITCAEIYAGNSLGICLFPTEVGYAHKQLKGRDFFGEAVAACRKRGIDVQAYFSCWATMPYKQHPEWRMILSDGEGTCDTKVGGWNRWGLCCMNGGFADYFMREIDEVNAKYDICGFWIDMMGWFGILCQCPDCRKRYREEVGAELPTVIDWNDPNFNRYVQWRAKCMSEFAARVHETIHKRHPERTVNIQTASFLNGWQCGVNYDFIRMNEYLAGDFTGDRFEQSYVCKLFSAFTQNRPMEFMTPRCEDLSFHTTERSTENLLMRAYAALANQSSFTLIDAIDPEGTLDERFYEHAQYVNDAYAKYEKYVLSDSVPLADIAVYFSFDSRVNIDCGKVPFEKRYDGAFVRVPLVQNIVKTFADGHFLFTFTGLKLTESLDKYPVVFLSLGARLTDEECAQLERYVANGGKLYASYCASLYHPIDGQREDFALAKLFGVHFRGITQKRTYIAPIGKSLLAEVATEKYPLMLDSRQCILEADEDAQVEGKLVLPLSEVGSPVNFSSGISDPPMIDNGTPALVRHRYGKGEVIYCAGAMENVGYDYHRRAMVRLLSELRGKQIVETNAPSTVEITVFRQPSANRLVVSVLNLPTDLPVQPLYDVNVRLNLPQDIQPKRLFLAPAETECPFDFADGAVSFTIPKLERFAMYLLV